MSEAATSRPLAIRRNFEPGTPGARAFDWLRRNLFGSALNTLLTILVLSLAALILPPLIRWGITQATLHGTTRASGRWNCSTC